MNKIEKLKLDKIKQYIKENVDFSNKINIALVMENTIVSFSYYIILKTKTKNLLQDEYFEKLVFINNESEIRVISYITSLKDFMQLLEIDYNYFDIESILFRKQTYEILNQKEKKDFVSLILKDIEMFL